MIEIIKTDKFDLSVDYNPDVNYVSVFNGNKFCSSVKVKNNGTRAVNNLTLNLKGFYFPEVSFDIPTIGVKKSVKIDCSKFRPSLDKLILLAESVYSEITVSLHSATKEILEYKIPVNIQAWNYWNADPSNYGEVASFVMPNHEYPVELLAKASRMLKANSPDNSMNGYDASTFEKFIGQIGCIWTTIVSEDIKYLTQVFSGTENGQKIMTVDMIKRFKQGNCLDLSILFCSCLERLNLCPLLIFVPGHVLVGVWLNPNEVLESPVSFDNKEISRRILDKKKPGILVFESTLLRLDTTTIQDAYASGIDTIKRGKIDFMVDIKAARISGIKPLPFAFSPIDLTDSEKIDIAGYKVLSAGSQRQDGWERKLLDISLRNPMLNLKVGKNILKLKNKDFDDLLLDFKANKLTDLIEGPDKDKEEKLKNIYRSARSGIEETGANNLFLALGSLVWYDVDDNVPHISPLIFVPATIVRKKAMTYEVRMRDEESLVNVTLIEMMRQMFGINFPEFEPLPLDESGIPTWQSVIKVFEDHVNEINRHQDSSKQWTISIDSYLGIFSFTKFLMWNDIHSHPSVVLSHPLIRGMIENIYVEDSIFTQNNDRDLSEFEDDLMMPVEFDSSQLKAVGEAHKDKSFVLYGPPGTGKSQTITNMIADAIYNGKKVLFVAEKKAALEVVQTRLSKIGLAPFCLELHSNKTDKKSFFAQLASSNLQQIGKGRPQKNDSQYFEKRDLLKMLSDTLELTTEALHKSMSQGVSVYEAIIQFLEKRYSDILFRYEDIKHLNKSELSLLCSEIESLDIVSNILGMHPGESGLVGLYPKHNNIENQNSLTATIKELPETIAKARKKAEGIINRLFRHKKPHEILKETKLWRELENLATLQHDGLQDIESISQRVENWKQAVDTLQKWYNFSDRVNLINSYKVPQVVDYYLKGHKGKETSGSFKNGYYKSIIDHHLNHSEHLRGFNGQLHENKIHQYLDLDQIFRELKKEHLITKLETELLNHFLTSAEQQQLAVLMRRMLSNGRGVSLRKVIADSFDVLQVAFPCMLMSPLSVAQYLDMKPELFDIIIFDEASQLETADSIGVIARGKTVIVVGDPKQLPPTRFFTSQSGSGEESVENEDADSILEDCITLGMPSYYLTRHYRSRHESLISFSNQNFYDNKLLTFPSVNDKEKKVRLIDPKGVYDFGKTRTNKIEAEAVVKFIIDLVQKTENLPSIGVVAFSKAQSNLIEDLLNAKLQRNKEVQKILDECYEPMFIKNLENVQGDERDIIIFSIGYGPDLNGNVSLNFGPINQGGGERRLNVAVSRAREEMVIFTSLKPYHIPKEGVVSKGVQSLRNFLSYASQEQFDTDEEEESLEVEVIIQRIAEILQESGITVVKNVGRSDFKVDIAVVDDKNPERYKLGIIIDGKNYRALPTARDREIVVPGVLKNLGWKLYRVWVIDWLNDPQKVIEGILNHIS